jgi:ATP-dependent Clp protease ATP-binding subunit ClpA
MFERFTPHARRVVALAQYQARRLRHRYIGTEHLLLAILEVDDDAARVLHDNGITTEETEAAIARYLGGVRDSLTERDAEALRAIGIDLDEVRARLEENFGPAPLSLPPDEPPRRRFGLRRSRRVPERVPSGHIPFSPRAKKVLELSLREALRLKHRSIGTEHILLGLIREGEGLAALILVQAGVDLVDLRRQVEATLRAAV